MKKSTKYIKYSSLSVALCGSLRFSYSLLHFVDVVESSKKKIAIKMFCTEHQDDRTERGLFGFPVQAHGKLCKFFSQRFSRKSSLFSFHFLMWLHKETLGKMRIFSMKTHDVITFSLQFSHIYLIRTERNERKTFYRRRVEENSFNFHFLFFSFQLTIHELKYLLIELIDLISVQSGRWWNDEESGMENISKDGKEPL